MAATWIQLIDGEIVRWSEVIRISCSLDELGYDVDSKKWFSYCHTTELRGLFFVDVESVFGQIDESFDQSRLWRLHWIITHLIEKSRIYVAEMSDIVEEAKGCLLCEESEREKEDEE